MTTWQAEGKVVASFTMMSGILILALPITVIGSNFAVEYADQGRRKKISADLNSKGRGRNKLSATEQPAALAQDIEATKLGDGGSAGQAPSEGSKGWVETWAKPRILGQKAVCESQQNQRVGEGCGRSRYAPHPPRWFPGRDKKNGLRLAPNFNLSVSNLGTKNT